MTIHTANTDNKLFIINVSLLTILLALATSCSKKAEEQMTTFEKNTESYDTSANNPLPSIGGQNTCLSSPSEPSGCAWVLSTDAVVYGTLTEIRQVRFPAVHRHRTSALPEVTQEIVDTCDGFIIPAMELDIDVKNVVHGNVGRNVTVRIGKSQLSLFNPMPLWDEEGNIKWVTTGPRPGEQLTVGQKIGVGMYYVSDHDLWSLAREPLFVVEQKSDGTEGISFQHIENSCIESPPRDIEGMTIEQLISAISNCSQDQIAEASARKADRRIIPETPPEWYMTAECFTIPENTNECEADSDCQDGKICINNECSQL